MSPPDKLPEGTTAAPAAPTAPTEGGVSAETVAKAQKLETSQKLGALGQEIEQAQAEAQAEAGVDTGTDEDTVPATPGTITQEKPKSGWAGFVSSLSAGWGKISEWFGDAGTKIGNWIKDLMGIKKGGEGVDPDEDKDTDTDSNKDTDTLVTPEGLVEDSEMLTPNAPVFTFLSNYTGSIYASDVPRVRPVHPVTGKRNVPHEGVDIPAPVGTPLHLTTSMTILSKKGSTLRGKLDDGTVVSFLHLSKMTSAKEGEKLPRGAWFANIGNEGGSTGPHLHFEVNDGEKDPIPYLDPGLVASAEKKIQQEKDEGEWIPLV